MRYISQVVEIFEYLAAQTVYSFFKVLVGFEIGAGPSLVDLVYQLIELGCFLEVKNYFKSETSKGVKKLQNELKTCSGLVGRFVNCRVVDERDYST